MKAAMRAQHIERLTGFGGFFRRAAHLLPGVALALWIALPVAAQQSVAQQRIERPTLNITGYKIDAEIDTATHHLAAKATVTFTAPENADMVSFGFHPALKVTKITDGRGKLLTGDRSADGNIRVTPATPIAKAVAENWTFEYEGTITGAEDGPVEGLKLAAIQEPITYLLYPARFVFGRYRNRRAR